MVFPNTVFPLLVLGELDTARGMGGDHTADMDRVERANGSPMMLSKLNLDIPPLLRFILIIDCESTEGEVGFIKAGNVQLLRPVDEGLSQASCVGRKKDATLWI